MKVKKSFHHLLLLPLLAAVLLTSCTRHSAAWPQLLEAEKLLDTDLPAAAALIDSLDAAPLQGEEAALYAILQTQADYKRYRPLTSDSLPRLAAAYYGTPRRRSCRAAMAWYTLGCCYTERHDDPAAIDAYLKAKDCFPDTTIRYYALTEQNLGEHYLNRLMCDEAARELRACRQHFVALADSSAVAYADYRLAICHIYRQDFAAADSLLNAAVQNPHADAALLRNACYQRAKIAYFEGRTDAAKQLLKDKMTLMPNKATLNGIYNLYADILYDEQLYDSAYHYYQQSVRCQSTPSTYSTSYGRLAELAAITGRTDSIRHFQHLHDAWADTVYTRKNQQDIHAVIATHAVEMEALQAKAEKERMLFAVVLAFLLLLLMGAAFVRRYRARKEQEVQALRAQLTQKSILLNNLLSRREEAPPAEPEPAAEEKEEAATSQSDETDKPLPPTDEQTALALPILMEMLNLSTELFRKKFPKAPSSILALDDHAQMAFRREYEQAVDECFVDFFSHLKEYAPSLNHQEQHYIVSQHMGIDSKTLRCLQGAEPSAFRMRRLRIHKKLPPVLDQALLPDGKAE